MLTFKQYLLIEDNKNPVTPSPVTADAAIKFGELSPEYAPFLDIENMSHQEIVDTYTKYNKQLKTNSAEALNDLLSQYDSGYYDESPVSLEKNIERKSNAIRTHLFRDQQKLTDPKSFYSSHGNFVDLEALDDATKLKSKDLFSPDSWKHPKDHMLRIYWDRRTGAYPGPRYGEPGYVSQGPKSPDLRGIYEPEPLRSIVKDSQGRAILGPIIEPKRIEVSPEAAQKVKVARDPTRVTRDLARQTTRELDEWVPNFLKQIMQNWEKEALELKLQQENPITQMQNLIKQSDAEIKFPGDLDLDDWPKVYDKFETKLPLDAVAPSKSASASTMAGKQVAGKVLKAAGAVGDFMDPPASIASRGLGSLSTALGAGTEVASGMAMAPMAIGLFTQQAGDPMGDFKASFAPGEFEKWQKEQEERMKKQNASAVQSLIDRPYDPNQASSRRRQQ